MADHQEHFIIFDVNSIPNLQENLKGARIWWPRITSKYYGQLRSSFQMEVDLILLKMALIAKVWLWKNNYDMIK